VIACRLLLEAGPKGAACVRVLKRTRLDADLALVESWVRLRRAREASQVEAGP
jgi:hypothetical protein